MKDNKKAIVLIALIILASSFIGAVVGAVTVSLWPSLTADNTEVVSTQSTVVDETTAFESEITSVNQTYESIFIEMSDVETTITDVVEEVSPAVVTVVGTVEVQLTPFGHSSTSEVSGSGVFITEEGYILTNNHVVEDTDELWVVLADGTREEAVLVGTDIYADLAVLKIEGEVPAVAILGNSDVLDPGESVIAIGSPLGEFMNSITVGVVSATGRSIDTGSGYLIENLIQTDAAINNGNSGGPLVNLAGEVIGINTLVVRSSSSGTVAEGLGFAIPSNTAAIVAEQIIETGYFSRPYLGIRWQSITPSLAYRYRLSVEYGVYVIEVLEDSPAQEAGLQSGDIITHIGGVELDDTNTYINLLFRLQPGESTTIGIVRDDAELELPVILGES